MQNQRQIFPLSLFIIILSACSNPSDIPGEFAEVNGKKIPIINIGLVADEPTTIGWSAIFEDVEIIPLETDEKCMIMNWMTGLSPNSLYLATQTGGVGPVRLMEFDFEGKYLRDFGGGGKGPGEHTGYFLDDIRYYKDHNVVFANFNGYPMENQLFTPEAEFLGEVNNSFKLGTGIGMLEENLFFTLGTSCGKPNYHRDSVLIEWHDKSGKPIKSIKRTKYPSPDNTGFSPFGSRESMYRYGDEWHLYSPGNDTIYRISGLEIDPIGIFELGAKGVQLNEIIDPGEVIGRFNIQIFAENDHYWIIKKSVFTKCEVEQYGAGQWGGMIDFDYSFIIIDKKSGKTWNVQFDDDLLGIIPWDAIAYYLNWDDSGRFYIVVGALDLVEAMDAAVEKGTVPANGSEKIKKLQQSIDENSNPMLFMFKERKEYKL